MVLINQSQLGEGSAIPTDSHHTPTFIQPSTQPQKIQQPRKPKRKDTQVPQPSDPIKNITDKAVYKELGNSLVRAATIVSSLEAEHDSGGGPWCQETIGDTIAQTRVESSDNEESLGKMHLNRGRLMLLMQVKKLPCTKPKKKGVVRQELGESTTTISSQLSSQQSHDKGKGILIEPAKPMNKKDLIRLDEETALNLQAEFDEEERLAREKAEKEEEANIALIETWDDIHAKIDADHQLAERMQAQEQEEFSIEEKATLFQQLLEKRRKHVAAKRA
ncbi:hypothetical protein Tco_0340514 [Tanacetum coccineum]